MLNVDTSVILGGTVTLLAAVIARLARRLYLSPLAKFPGPRLAAASRLYELYYDGYQPGGYICKLRELHKKYGIYCDRGADVHICI